MLTPAEERDAHLAAMQWFEKQKMEGHELFTHQELMQGFMWHGHRLPLIHQTQGIWKPSSFTSALTFKTAAPKPRQDAPYADRIDDTGLLRYKFADSPSKQWTNKAMIVSYERKYPLAWLVGIRPANTIFYYVRFPAFIARVDHRHSEFVIAIEEAALPVPIDAGDTDSPIIERRYSSRWTKSRIHQHDFREHVIGAYDIACAICDLPHAQLLEAAHIIPDAQDMGTPEVSNGLALCRIHHAAYDRNLIGIDAERRIHVAERARRLEIERDHFSLSTFESRHLTHVPRSIRLQPDQNRLDRRFRAFLEAEESAMA